MAEMRSRESNGSPYCTGCGAEMHWLPEFLDSRGKRTLARDVAAFGRQHAGCPDRETWEVTAAGITVIDRRGAVA
jgi:hypothetical protein